MKRDKAGMQIKRKVRSFEADDDVDLLIKAGQEDGVKVSALCNAALRKHGMQVLRELLTAEGKRNLRWTDYYPNDAKPSIEQSWQKSKIDLSEPNVSSVAPSVGAALELASDLAGERVAELQQKPEAAAPTARKSAPKKFASANQAPRPLTPKKALK